jgi:hypothetical protein
MPTELVRYLYAADFRTLIRKERRIPVCGKAFCDACGDCLACYGQDGPHWWIAYEDDLEPDYKTG